MARAGSTLSGGGKHLVFRGTRASTRGARLSLGKFVAPGGGAVPPHVLGPGQGVLVEPNSPHTSWNAGEGELHHVVTLAPALNHEISFESVSGLVREGFSPETKSLLNLLRLARLFGEHDHGLAGLPGAVQKPLFLALGLVARLLGRRQEVPKPLR